MTEASLAAREADGAASIVALYASLLTGLLVSVLQCISCCSDTGFCLLSSKWLSIQTRSVAHCLWAPKYVFTALDSLQCCCHRPSPGLPGHAFCRGSHLWLSVPLPGLNRPSIPWCVQIEGSDERMQQAQSAMPSGDLAPIARGVQQCLGFYLRAGAITPRTERSLRRLAASLQVHLQPQL